MPTLFVDAVDRQFLFGVGIREHGNPDAHPEHGFQCLFDTGAQASAVSPDVVERLGLTASGHRLIGGATDKDVVLKCYPVQIKVYAPTLTKVPPGQEPQFIAFGKYVEVTGLPYQPRKFDVLLGMDVIESLHVSMQPMGRMAVSN